MGLFRYWLATKLLLLFVGLMWCFEAWKRRHEDFGRLRDANNPAERNMVIIYWLLTTIVVVLLATSGTATVSELTAMIKNVARW
jgi:hypothetical protein